MLRQRGNREVTNKQFGDWSFMLYSQVNAAAPSRRNPARLVAGGQPGQVGNAFGRRFTNSDLSKKSSLLQVDGSIMPRLVELCAPHFVHALVVGAAEGHGRAKPNVEIVQIFQGSY
jgi:hypothetical protein